MNETESWISERLPVDEDLDRPRLRELATELGGRRDLWEEFVRHDAEQRFYVQLYRDVHLDVWLICWLNQQDTGFHDHDLSSGAVYVCDGIIAEDRFRFDESDLRVATREHGPGSAFEFDAAYIHRMRHTGGGPATSIHCYSPALWRMGYYEPDGTGALCRSSITYADEMGNPGVAAATTTVKARTA